MKTTAKKIHDVFFKYGIKIEEEKIHAEIESALKRNNGFPKKELFVSDVLANISDEGYGDPIDDFEKFRLKCGLSEEWKGVPSWFVEQLTIKQVWKKKTYKLSAQKGKDLGGQPNNLLLEKEPFFFKKIKKERKEEMLIKMKFEPDLSETMLRVLVLGSYREIEEDMERNKEFKKMVVRIKSLINDEYKKRVTVQNESDRLENVLYEILK